MRSTALFFFVLLAACGGSRSVNDGDGGAPGMDGGSRVDGAGTCTRGPEDNASACNDGCDNEDPTDGFVDCEDRGCCTVRTDCPASSFCGRMPAFDAGPRPMECATMAPENTASACGNGCDDDFNGFADCNDFDCCGVVSCPTGTTCGDRPMPDGGVTAPRCDGAVGTEDSIAACMDGCSNDADTFADCNDRDCCSVRRDCGAGTYCGDRAMRDAGPPPMVCDGSVGTEDTAAACMDGCSNDMDPFVDCNDSDCCPVRRDCGAGTYCGDRAMRDAGPAPMLCDGSVGAEDTAAACMDGCSNDMDPFVDCNDRDCCSVRRDCPASTFCGRPDAGPCPSGGEDTVAQCMDGCSNDGDRFVDCDDFSCCGLVSCGPTTSCGRRDAGVR